MAYVPVPKDLTKVKTKVMFNLTKRQLICFTGGALIGVPLFFLLRKPTGNSVAAMCMMLVMLPFFMLAMYEKHGQPLEKIVGNILKVAVIRPKQRPYQTNNFYAVLKRQEMLDKEVYDIVHRNKKMAASDVRKNRGKNCAAGKDKEKTVPRRVWITSSSAAPRSSFGSSAAITITATASRWMMESLASAYRVFPTRCCATGSETRYFPPTMSCWPT